MQIEIRPASTATGVSSGFDCSGVVFQEKSETRWTTRRSCSTDNNKRGLDREGSSVSSMLPKCQAGDKLIPALAIANSAKTKTSAQTEADVK
jgi:hypothetical protein